MENTLLVGLSRQVVLERQMDVVANNIANINTNGYKADRSLFEEYLTLERARGQFRRLRPPRPLRAGPRHLPRFRAGPERADQEPARRRDRRRRLPGGADARAASATPATANCRSTTRASSSPPSGYPVLGTSGPIVFQQTDQRHQHRPGRQRHRAGRRQPRRFGPRQAAPGQLRRRAEAGEGRLQPLFGRRRQRRAGRHQLDGCARASSRSRTSIRSPR